MKAVAEGEHFNNYMLSSLNFCIVISLLKREVLKHRPVIDSIFKLNSLSFGVFFLLQ